jgi:hypothetical protein
VSLDVTEYYHALFAVVKDGLQTITLQQLIEIYVIVFDMTLDKSALGGVREFPIISAHGQVPFIILLILFV